MPVAPELHLDELFGTLERHGVRSIIIGGQAGRAWGSPTVTRDLDVAYARDDDNLERVAAALRDLEAGLRVPDDDDVDVPLQLDAEALKGGFNFTFRTRAGDDPKRRKR